MDKDLGMDTEMDMKMDTDTDVELDTPLHATLKRLSCKYSVEGGVPEHSSSRPL